MNDYIHKTILSGLLACTIWLTGLMQVLSQTSGKNETGLPFIKNFPAGLYDAHSQNFDILQNSNGLMYFANFAGVLEFDGIEWQLITTDKISLIRSLAPGKNNRIYAGGMGEFGYLSRNSKGEIVYIPLNDSLDNSQDNIKNTLNTQGITFFISDNSIIYNKGDTWHNVNSESKILSSFIYKDQLILFFQNKGMYFFDKGNFKPVNGGDIFKSNMKIVAVFEFENQMMIVSSSNGVFAYDGSGIEKYSTVLNLLLQDYNVTTGIKLNNGEIALGTLSSGILIINSQAEIVKKIDQSAGLQNQYIHKLFIDRENNLWAALNNGIALINYPSPLSYFNERTELYGVVKDIIRFEGSIYAATYQGLFKYNSGQDIFNKISGINSACWHLEDGGEHLFIATSEGVFSMQNDKPKQLSDAFTYYILKERFNKGYYYCGRNDGLYLTRFRNNDSYNCKKIRHTLGNVIKIMEDKDGLIWFETVSLGVFMYDISSDSVFSFGEKQGLPTKIGNGINLINNEILISSRDGLYKYEKGSRQFIRTELFYSDSLNDQFSWNAMLVEAPDRSIWATRGDEKSLCVFVPGKDSYKKSQTPYLPVKERVIQNIYFDRNNIVYLGGPEGIICYNKAVKPDYNYIPGIIISRIECGRDSVLYENLIDTKVLKDKFKEYDVTLSHNLNSVSFSFSLPSYHFTDEILFQHQLAGYEGSWSEWTDENFKEYTNLSKGEYTFRVRAKNIFDKISNENVYHFKVLPPWYSTYLAYFIYFLILTFIIYLIIRWRSRQLIREKKVLEDKVAERTAEVVKQKEEIEQKSEELADKNLELEKINRVVKSINSEIHFKKLMKSLLDNIIKTDAVERATILMWDSKTEVYKYKASIGWDLSAFSKISLSPGQAESRYLSGGKELYPDVFLKTSFSGLEGIKALNELEKPASILVLIIRIDNKIDGFLILENMHKQNAFGDKEIDFLQNLKEHIISAFIKVNILEDLQSTLENLKDTQSQLVQSEKLASLGQLTAGIAHEIQNPLNFVNNFSTLASEMAVELLEIAEGIKDKLDEDTFDDILDLSETIKENVIKINEHGKRAESIVKGMLQHSRGKSGEFQLTDINKLVQEYVNLAYHGMRAKDKSFNTKFNTDYDPDAGNINCVPQDFSRAVLNIVNNACYAVYEKSKKLQDSYKPEIDISTKRKDDKVIIRIKDNGTGIPDKVIDKIFNPFFTTKPSGKGTGLGLSMTHDIITQLHKGHLNVESKAGEYTLFTITVPVNVEKFNTKRKT